ncbi:MAG: fumarylacetoacetase, partial [Aeromicrobium sp.]
MSGVVDFGERTLPYGVFAHPDGPRVCVAFGELLIDLVERLGDTEFRSSSLNAFMACGPEKWADVRSRVLELVAGGVT